MKRKAAETTADVDNSGCLLQAAAKKMSVLLKTMQWWRHKKRKNPKNKKNMF